MDLRILNIVEDTTVDGIGWRTSIYCAGCLHHCVGCHNKSTWSFNQGELLSTSDIFDRIKGNYGNVTFSGGDPMYKAEAFAELARMIRGLHKTIWCYTGFLFEDVVKDERMRKLLPYLEVLVDGEYVEDLKDTNLLFRGSSNQRLIDVQKTLKEGSIVIFDIDPYPKF